ncbi:MAG: dihydrodipicolinate synthase family protein, partial [Candidatus Acidiferrales bacterium]
KQAVLPAANLATKFGIPGIKCAMDRLGYYGGPPRAPLLPLGEPAKHEIETILASVRPVTSAAD